MSVFRGHDIFAIIDRYLPRVEFLILIKIFFDR